jgi:hypothetical protein
MSPVPGTVAVLGETRASPTVQTITKNPSAVEEDQQWQSQDYWRLHPDNFVLIPPALYWQKFGRSGMPDERGNSYFVLPWMEQLFGLVRRATPLTECTRWRPQFGLQPRPPSQDFQPISAPVADLTELKVRQNLQGLPDFKLCQAGSGWRQIDPRNKLSRID